MALGRVKTWINGEILTAPDLNAEFDNILNNPVLLISPLTGAINANGFQITNLTLHTVSANPSVSGEGRIYYQSTLDQIQVDDGVVIRNVPTISTVTTGDLIYASAANQWTRRAIGSANQVLTVSGGVPTWAAAAIVDLATGVTGTLPVENGGTETTTHTLNGALYGNGTSAILATAQGPANSVLTANAGAPVFSATPTITSLVANTSIQTGSSGTAITQLRVYSQALDVASVASNTSAEQTFTVTGLATTDKVFVNKPSLSAGLVIGNARVSAVDTLALTFGNLTASPIDPGSETYTIVAIRSA